MLVIWDIKEAHSKFHELHGSSFLGSIGFQALHMNYQVVLIHLGVKQEKSCLAMVLFFLISLRYCVW